MTKLLLGVLVATSLLGCQTPRHKEFEHVQQGMEKDLVLEAAGNPKVTRRWHGKDRWIYEYKSSPNGSQTREVHFENGKAVYVGTKVVPAVSAEEQDRINEQSNEQEEARITEERKAWEEQRGVARFQKTSVPADTNDRRFQESMWGTRNVEQEKRKLAPTFESID